MVALRVVALALALSMAVCAVAWLATGDRRWLRRALRLLTFGVAIGLAFFGVLALERVGVL